MKYIVTSDIHLGHQRTPTKHVIQSFNKFILTDANKDADMMFISGDLFDRLLDFGSFEVLEIVTFIGVLLEYCYVNNIMLRVLYGTPSHDHSQLKIIGRINSLRKNPCDYMYHEVLDIEYVEKFDKHILYIPDEWSNDHEDVEKQIESKLLARGVSQVDIAILHGQFFYQLPIANYKGFYFKEDYFLNLVKGYIHIGHYHNFSTLDRIIANGSLERMAHGDEDPKGYVIVEDGLYRFVENTDAYIYKTIRVTKSSTYESLDRNIHKYPANSYIRLQMNKEHPFNINFADIRNRYPDYFIQKKMSDADEISTMTDILYMTELEDEGGYTLESNIHEVLLSTITNKYDLTPTSLERIKEHIKPLEVVEDVS